MNKLIGKKIGMTQIFSPEGDLIPVTVVEAGPCTVSQVKTVLTDGYNAVQMSFVNKKKKVMKECLVAKPEEFQVGQEITVEIFKPGDLLSVCGISKGKGFMGTVRRWHFGRGDMTHGSKSHRLPGSIGAGTTPGRVLKGKRMAGHVGNVRVTQKNLKVISVDKNIILLRGSVPGPDNGIVEIVKS